MSDLVFLQDDLISYRLNDVVSKNIEQKPGVYFLIMEGLKSNRFNGIDNSGLIYIGKSVNLNRRVTGLKRGILFEDDRYHSISRNFHSIFSKKDLPKLWVKINYINKSSFSVFEKSCLEQYFQKFYDLPLLNFKR